MANWYINRLMTMSGAEIYFRIKQTISGYLKEKFGYKVEALSKDLVSKKNMLGFHTKNAKFHPNTLRIFGADFNYDNPQEINWQKDFLSGEVFLPAFYRKINIRENIRMGIF